MAIAVSSMTPSCHQLVQQGCPIVSSGTKAKLRLGLLNLMPDKATTERHWLRMLAATGLDLNLELLMLADWTAKTTPAAYLQQHYAPWTESKADIFIVTGAPLGLIEDKKVGYWPEMEVLFNTLNENNRPTLYLCWAANTALSYLYGIPRVVRDKKLSGLFEHTKCVRHALLEGLPGTMQIPHSRYAQADPVRLAEHSDLNVLIDSAQAGNCLISDDTRSRLFLLGHPEYEVDTLHKEYQRDLAKGKSPAQPFNYYCGNNSAQLPQPVWQEYGVQILRNWLISLSR